MCTVKVCSGSVQCNGGVQCAKMHTAHCPVVVCSVHLVWFTLHTSVQCKNAHCTLVCSAKDSCAVCSVPGGGGWQLRTLGSVQCAYSGFPIVRLGSLTSKTFCHVFIDRHADVDDASLPQPNNGKP